jgi:hypothetical protein
LVSFAYCLVYLAQLPFHVGAAWLDLRVIRPRLRQGQDR